MEDVIGDFQNFFNSITSELNKKGINTNSYEISHLGYKAKTFNEYNEIKSKLLTFTRSIAENVHNGRPISKIILKNPLVFDINHKVNMIELMPPKNTPNRIDGLEHIGFVVGEKLDDFKEIYVSLINEIQDQGPYCQPACIILANGFRAKFYNMSLQEVIEMEGTTFKAI